MALLLAPYNNAMRIGQGFNSYTQQICIDDAVVLDSGRHPNSLTNDGWTMEDMGKAMKDAADNLKAEDRDQEQLDAEYEQQVKDYEKLNEGNHPALQSKAPAKSEAENAAEAEAQVAIAEKELAQGKPTEDNTTEDDLQKQADLRKKKRDIQLKEEREKRGESNASKAFDAGPELDRTVSTKTAAGLGAVKPSRRFAFVNVGRRGPSQIVTYSSRFINKVSDVTDDMNISGSLSIKYNMIGGSGRGSFLDSSKITDSDLNFYISVKVINQTINMKDHLCYQALSGDRKLEGADFLKVFGDSFVSGFLEGGEFNAVVSMKVLNEEKKMDIAASAKVALTVGPLELGATAKVNIAKENLKANTETTIQVSWSGGGHLKNSNEKWDLDSLTEVASRFPDLVAVTPQRTYAILTKYESLRSFQEKKPETFTPLQYENANVYTNAMLDAYMDYKTLYRKLGEDIFELEGGTRVFSPPSEKKTTLPAPAAASTPSDTASSSTDGEYEKVENDQDKEKGETEGKQEKSKQLPKPKPLGPLDPRAIHDSTIFEASIQGLDHARRNIRYQMNKIVKEVDRITADPKVATDENAPEAYQSPSFFRTRLPSTQLAKKPRKAPLAIDLISTETDDADQPVPSLYPEGKKPLDAKAQVIYDKIINTQPTIGRHLRMEALIGSPPETTPGSTSTASAASVFNNLEFLRSDFAIQKVEVQVVGGAVGALSVRYSNGMVMTQGSIRTGIPTIPLVMSLQRQEKIISCSIEVGRKAPPTTVAVTGASSTTTPAGDGKEKEKPKESPPGPIQITAIKLYTNRGQSLVGQAADARVSADKTGLRGSEKYIELQSVDLDPLMEKGHLKGFWGYSTDGIGGGQTDGVYALAPIWGDIFI